MNILFFTIALAAGVISFYLKYKADRRPNTESGRLDKEQDLLEAKICIIIGTFGMFLALIISLYNISK